MAFLVLSAAALAGPWVSDTPAGKGPDRRILPFKLAFLLGCARLALGILRSHRLLERLSTWVTLARLPPGQAVYLRPFSDDPIAVNEILNWRSYDDAARIQKEQIVLDVGAHIGIFALHAASLVGEHGRVIAIEPEGENFRLLMTNCRLSGLRNVNPFNVALSSSVGKRKLHIFTLGGTASHQLEGSAPERKSRRLSEDRVAFVDCETVDSIIEKLRLESVDVIKIDVEGHEIPVLEGGIGVLKRFKPVVVVEVGVERQDPVRGWFQEHGYHASRDPNFPWIICARASRIQPV
jgi:FkbM family methyltransferase